ncbi:hypothetical protein ACFWYW_23120 [Nonomuraea sp. NPDC059023]|uniref:hypothetical protein n=1 Tax=unclassified Nonomuraea TaxID=2593643 RepID=UPI00368AE663
MLDTTIVNIAIPGLRASLGASLGQALWALNGYTLALAGHETTANESVAAYLPAVNRDPVRFADPDLSPLSRRTRRHLARVETRIACPALLRRFPALRLAVLPEEVPTRTDRVVYGVGRLLVEW